MRHVSPIFYFKKKVNKKKKSGNGGKRELIALLNLSSWCLVMVERLFLAMPRGCLQFVIVVFPDHTHLLFFGTSYIRIAVSKDCAYYLTSAAFCKIC